MTNDKNNRSALANFLDEYEDALQFIGIAAMVFAILQIIYFQFYVDSAPFYSYLRFSAELSTGLLNLIGEEIILAGRTLTSTTGPSVTVVEGCDALRIYSVLVAAIIAYDSSIKQKVIGILIGVSIMFLLNIVRISLLLWIDIHFTDVFDLFHHTVLPFGLWLFAMLYFYYWGSNLVPKEQGA